MRKLMIFGALLTLCAAQFVGQVAAQDATVEPTPEATAQVEPQLRDATMLQDFSLVQEQPCTAPCWRNITPGVTTWDNALTILQHDATLENVNVQQDSQSLRKIATWQQKGGNECCQLYSEDGATVSVIFLRTAPGMTVGEVIDSQGNPTYMLGTQYSDNQAVMNLIYPVQQIIVYAYIGGIQGDLTADSEIVGVLFVTPDEMHTTLTTSNLYKWDGYQSFKAYSEAGPNFDVTPDAASTEVPASP